MSPFTFVLTHVKEEHLTFEQIQDTFITQKQSW